MTKKSILLRDPCRKKGRFTHSTKFIILFLALCQMFMTGNAMPDYTVYSAEEGMIDEQQRKITGNVKDETGEAVIGATVIIPGTSIGTLTDIDGNFTLDVPSGSKVLSISFVGLESQEIIITGSNNFSIVLKRASIGLEEVVVVGYGVQKKESVVGAITQVDNATIVKSGISRISNAISGKLSGVLTMQETGQPGNNNSEIVIRGLSSWNSSNPLVMVDGVERDFKDLDPNEINTISVLKDASATAVFGAKGANGVILVTTKRGSIGKPRMDFSTSVGGDRPTRIADHISSYTTLSMYNVANMNQKNWDLLIPDWQLEKYRNPLTPLESLQYPDVNWFKELTNNYALNTQNNLNIRGGTNFFKYFFSLGHMSEGDYFKSLKQGDLDTRYYYNRYNYRSNLDFSLSKSTQLNFTLGGSVGVQNAQRDSPFTDFYLSPGCWFPAYYPDWVLEMVPDTDYPEATGLRRASPFNSNRGNPYVNMNEGTFDRFFESKFFSDISIEQKFDFIVKGLSAKGKVAYNTYFENISVSSGYTFPIYTLDFNKIGVDENNDGIADENPWYRVGQGNEAWKQSKFSMSTGDLQDGYYRHLYYEFALQYQNRFGKHSVSALALMNRQQKNNGVNFPFFNQGYVGRATYDYSSKYFLEFNIGLTGSEQFAPGNRYGLFPSYAIGWTVSEERLFKEAVPWMNRLKFRYSDGKVGSDAASGRWLYVGQYQTSGDYILEDRAPNTLAQWEQSHKKDLGVEVGIFKDLFRFTFDLFDEFRDKMLLTPRTVTYFVGNSFKDLNKGSVKKHGFEFEAEFNKSISADLSYYIRGMMGANETRILFRDDLPYAPDYLKAAGKPLGAQTLGIQLDGNGYFNSIDDIHISPAPLNVEALILGDWKYVDFNADGSITSLDQHSVKGSYYAPVTYSFGSGLSFKGFNFSFMFQGNAGKYVKFVNAFNNEFLEGSARVHISQLDYWTPTNMNASHPNLHNTGKGSNPNLTWGGGSAGSASGENLAMLGQTWRKADYLRLKEVYLGYTFNSSLLERIAGVSALNVYATGNNLLTFTDLIEGDPEATLFSYGFYPIMASLKLGIKISF